MSNLLLERSAQMARHPLLPREYQQVEYIESTGTQWIDTGYNLRPNLGYEIAIQCTDLNTSALYGRWTANDQCFLQLLNGGFTIGYGTSNSNHYVMTFGLSDLNTFKVIDKKLYINDAYVYTYTENLIGGSSFLIFAQSTFKGAARCYYLKLFDGQILAHHFVPCYRKLDEIAGMYDIIGGQFFTNAGTGILLKGNAIG